MPSRQQKIRKEWSRKIFNFWTKSHLTHFEKECWKFPWSRKCLSVVFPKGTYSGSFLSTYKYSLSPSKIRNLVFLGKCSRWNLDFRKGQKRCAEGSPSQQKKGHILIKKSKTKIHIKDIRCKATITPEIKLKKEQLQN